MAYESGGSFDLVVDVLVLAGVIALIPKGDIVTVILISVFAISIVAVESRIRRFKLTGYVNSGVNAFRPMFWATALLLIVLYHKPMQGILIWNNSWVSFFLSTMLVFLAMLLVAYRAASHQN
jgi:hypothetical protein